jgi:hypothetical protein
VSNNAAMIRCYARSRSACRGRVVMSMTRCDARSAECVPRPRRTSSELSAVVECVPRLRRTTRRAQCDARCEFRKT